MVLICYRKYTEVTKILFSNRPLFLYCKTLNITYGIKIVVNFLSLNVV